METAVKSKSSLPELENGPHTFPSDLLDPAVKGTKEYCLKYVKAAYYRHQQNQSYTASRRENWIVNRKYAEGNQSTAKYTRWLTKLKNAQNQTLSYLDLDWSIVKIIPKFRDVVLSYLDKIDFDIFCDAINPEAAMDREMNKWRIWAEKELQPFFQQQAEKAKEKLDANSNEFLPESMQELEMFMQYAFRLNYEISMELGQQMVYYENDWKEIRKEILKDAFDLGVMAACVEIDRFSGRIKIRYCDPVNMVLEDFRGSRGSAMQRIGEIRKISISQLKLEAGSQFTDEEYYKIANKYCGFFGNPDSLMSYSDYINTDTVTQHYRDFDNVDVLLMDLQWDTVDRFKFERKKVAGVDFTFEKKFNEPLGKKEYQGENGQMLEKEVYPTDVKMVYGAIWVIGSDFIYNYGKSANIPRPLENPKECYKKFKFYRIANTSMLERMIPYADSIQTTWLKLQNLKARAMPKGIMIEIGAFENVFLDGKKMTARELLEIAMQTGIIVYRRNSEEEDIGNENSGKPVEETEGGLGKEFNELSQSLINDIDMIRQVSGVNEFMDASTPNANALVGVGNMAITGAQNALYPILSGFISVNEELSSTIGLLIQLLAQYKQLSGYVPAIGAVGTKMIEIGSEVAFTSGGTPVIYGMRVQARATQAQKERILAFVDASIASSQDPSKGGLEVPDGIEISRLIENGTNLKLISAIIGYRLEKYKKRLQAVARENIALDSKEKQAQAKASKEAAVEFEREKAEIEKGVYTHKRTEDIRFIREEYALRDSNDKTKGEVKKEIEREKVAV